MQIRKRRNDEVVIPAKAGIQVLNIKEKTGPRLSPGRRLVFAGMTILLSASGLLSAHPSVTTPEDKILAKGFSAYMDGSNKQAESYFEEVLRLNPKNNAAKQGLSKVKVRLKKAEDEKKAKALHLSKAKVKEGKELMKTGDMVAAADSFLESLDSTPGYKPAENGLNSIKKKMANVAEKKKLNLSTWSFARGTMAYLERDWAKAYRIWSERSRLEPDNVALANATARAENKFKKMMITEQEDFFRRGARAFYEQGLYKEAKLSWSKVVALRPEDIEALEGEARAEEAILRIEGKGRNNEVQDLLEKGLEFYASQDWKRALGTFKQLAALEPNMSTAQDYITKINSQMNSGMYSPTGVAGGESLFRKNKSSSQGNESVAVPDKMGNFTESRRELESQLKREPSNINIQRELDRVTKAQDDESEKIYKEGLIAYSQGNRGLAIQQWKQVLVINPDHKKAMAALKKARAEEERSSDTPETSQ